MENRHTAYFVKTMIVQILHGLVIILSILGISAYAKEPLDIYSAEVYVHGDLTAVQGEAMAEGLRSVLVKVSGDREAASQPGIEEKLATAEKYVKKFKSRELEASKDAEHPAYYKFSLQYQERSINNLITKVGLKPWGRDRPTTLIVMIMEGGSGVNRFVNPSEDPEIISAWENRANARGLPILFPLLDLQEQNSLPIEELKQGILDPLLKLTNTYIAEGVMLGIVKNDASGMVDCQWHASFSGKRHSWTSQGRFSEGALDEGLDGLADYLATTRPAAPFSRYAPVHSLVVSIDGIFSANDNAIIEQLFKTMDIVENFGVKQMEERRIKYGVEVRGGQPALEHYLARSNLLLPIEGQPLSYELLKE